MIVKAVQAGHGSDEAWVNLRAEARALRLAESSGVTPALLLLDGEQRLLVQEDIEGSHSLADVLLGTDGAAAREALVRYGAALGRLHAATPLELTTPLRATSRRSRWPSATPARGLRSSTVIRVPTTP
jgi:hypothetical protein